MSIINPNIQKILRQAGMTPTGITTTGPDSIRKQAAQVLKDQDSKTVKEKTDLESRLDAAGLSLDEVLTDLSQMARMGSTESIRMRAIENALRAHGINKDQPASVPSINIIIHDPTGAEECNFNGINPILLPRKMHEKIEPEESEEETIN